MTDQPKCIPDPEFNPDAALRETYTRMLRPEERQQLEALCKTVLMLTREAPAIVDRVPGGGMADDFGAAAAELRYLGGYLAFTSEWGGDGMTRDESRLADAAEKLGVRVVEIADELDARIAATLASRPN